MISDQPWQLAQDAMEAKLRFAIREGDRTIGAGVVAKISDSGFEY